MKEKPAQMCRLFLPL